MSVTLPITLITATPGGGKTAFAVQLMAKAVKAGRPLFVAGIPELKLPYIPTPPISDWTEMRQDPENPGIEMPYFTFPENSLIVLDEAQRIYRVRATGSKVPDHVAAFETVRHTGVTFILITQNPSFIDAHIRKLVGQHIHLRDVGLLGRWYYEWPECANPEKFATAPIKKKWKLPSSSFSLYKSSSLHIKRQYSIPPVMVIFVVCVMAMLYGVYRVYFSIDRKIAPEKSPAPEVAKVPVVSAETMTPASASATDGASYLTSFVPITSDHPESAPAYAPLRKIVAMPRVAMGICSSTRCACYTQQATNAGLDDAQCRRWLDSAPFDPYRAPEDASVASHSVRPPEAVEAPTEREQPQW